MLIPVPAVNDKRMTLGSVLPSVAAVVLVFAHLAAHLTRLANVIRSYRLMTIGDACSMRMVVLTNRQQRDHRIEPDTSDGKANNNVMTDNGSLTHIWESAPILSLY